MGEFDISKYDKEFKSIIDTRVILTKERLKHIEKHKDVIRYIKDIKKILNDPDSIYKELTRERTYWIVKELDNNVKITIKFKENTDNKMNSIIQMQIMKKNRIDKYKSKGKIREIFDKNKIK